MIRGNRSTVKEVLRSIARNRSHLGKLAGWLLEHGRGTGMEAAVRLKRKGAKTVSAYDPNKNEVEVRREDEGNAYILMHEIVHAVTQQKIPGSLETTEGRYAIHGAAYRAALEKAQKSPAVAPEMKALARVYLVAVESLGMSGTLFEGEAPLAGKPDEVARAGLPYGLGNIDEFLAEAFTNDRFRGLLRRVSAEGGRISLWARLVDAVRRVAGLPARSRTLLDEVMTHGQRLLAGEDAYTASGRRKAKKWGRGRE